ncbi:MAG: low affinity iron permease family protein [Ginsengibacter sp.]|jgi:low affinity Fe/Cu permease
MSKSISKMKKTRVTTNKTKNHSLSTFFNRFSAGVTRITGGVYAFIVAIVIVLVWGITGPIFKFSDTWQLVINTGTTIVTFLMVFVIQHSQNKDTIALQLKLDELLAASGASNQLIKVEDLTDEELDVMKKFYSQLSVLSKKEKENRIHSLEEHKEEIENELERVKNNPPKD